MNDVTMDALQSLLRGLSARQRATADNIANLETPGFTARRVEFEQALTDALKSGGNVNVTPTVVRSSDAPLPNGNNVSIDKEIVSLQDTSLRYQLAIEAVTSKLSLIRTSIRGN